jgi:rsbT co-antagonist protein RsbR
MAVDRTEEDAASPRSDRYDEGLRTQLRDILGLIGDTLESGGEAALEAGAQDLSVERLVAELRHSVQSLLRVLGNERLRAAGFRVELEERLATIEMQNAALRELSMPLIEIGRGVLCVPIVGILDHHRGEHIMNELLQAVASRGIELVVIDVTAVESMDTHTVQRFMAMAQSVRLLGADCTLTGVRPTVAQAIVSAGLELGAVKTVRTVQEALARHGQKKL